MRDEHHFFPIIFTQSLSVIIEKNKFLRFRQYISRAWMNLRLQNDKWADIIQICYKSDFQHITYFHTSFLNYSHFFFLFKVMKKTTIVLEMPSGVLSTHNRRTRGAHRKDSTFCFVLSCRGESVPQPLGRGTQHQGGGGYSSNWSLGRLTKKKGPQVKNEGEGRPINRGARAHRSSDQPAVCSRAHLTLLRASLSILAL